MAGENQSVGSCAEFEMLLSDALDHALTEGSLQNFQAHGATCAACRMLLADAEAGRNSLRALQEAEPPAGLVSNILVATSGFQTGRSAVLIPQRTSWWEQLTAGFIEPVIAGIRQPRFVMSFGMAFFSVSVCLSLAGIKLSDLRTADLRPSAIKRNYYETSGRVVKYYENIRFVYEFESRVREFKRITEPAETRQEEDKTKERRNDTSGQPDRKEDRDYSRGDAEPVLAQASEPAVGSVTTLSVTTFRRSL